VLLFSFEISHLLTPKPLLVSGYPDIDRETGEIKEILGIMSDISRYRWAESVQKRRVEEVLELKRQQEKYGSSNGMCIEINSLTVVSSI
jgi:hypothetical protein